MGASVFLRKEATTQAMTENANAEASATAADENRLIAERREKLKALRAQGIAYPNDFKVDSFAGDLQDEFADKDTWTAEAIEAAPRRVAVAGRIILMRGPAPAWPARGPA